MQQSLGLLSTSIQPLWFIHSEALWPNRSANYLIGQTEIVENEGVSSSHCNELM
jgi:hypothetical protein